MNLRDPAALDGMLCSSLHSELLSWYYRVVGWIASSFLKAGYTTENKACPLAKMP